MLKLQSKLKAKVTLRKRKLLKINFYKSVIPIDKEAKDMIMRQQFIKEKWPIGIMKYI